MGLFTDRSFLASKLLRSQCRTNLPTLKQGDHIVPSPTTTRSGTTSEHQRSVDFSDHFAGVCAQAHEGARHPKARKGLSTCSPAYRIWLPAPPALRRTSYLATFVGRAKSSSGLWWISKDIWEDVRWVPPRSIVQKLHSPWSPKATDLCLRT